MVIYPLNIFENLFNLFPDEFYALSILGFDDQFRLAPQS